ncbi:MAG: hypothetical protein ABR498_07810, partial [Candidatus Dormibacteria bacterium]
VDWQISNTPDTTRINQPGGTATVTYTVTVTRTGTDDTDHVLSGDVTLSNPNTSDLVGIDLTDSVDNGGACAVSNGTNVTIPAASSAMLTYRCDWTAAPSSSAGSDIAIATWDPVLNNTPSGSVSVQTPFSFATPANTTNTPVTVSDTDTGMLGSTAATNTYQYARVLNVPASGCQTYAATASIQQTGQSAAASVVACGTLAATVSTPSTGSGNALRIAAALVLIGCALCAGALALRHRVQSATAP